MAWSDGELDEWGFVVNVMCLGALTPCLLTTLWYCFVLTSGEFEDQDGMRSPFMAVMLTALSGFTRITKYGMMFLTRHECSLKGKSRVLQICSAIHAAFHWQVMMIGFHLGVEEWYNCLFIILQIVSLAEAFWCFQWVRRKLEIAQQSRNPSIRPDDSDFNDAYEDERNTTYSTFTV